MTEAGNQWMLFGIDTRQFAQVWFSAWRDFLFAEASPVRSWLGDAVTLHREDRTVLCRAGREVPHADPQSPWHARQLPDALVLSRRLRLPRTVEAELDSVLQLEVSAASPFGAADTLSGWIEIERDQERVEIALALASRKAVDEWLEAPSATAQESAAASGPEGELPTTVRKAKAAEQFEIWAQVGEAFVALGGFAESAREAAYRQRLLRFSSLLGGALALLLCSALLFGFQQKTRADGLRDLQARVAAEAATASTLRERLVVANEKSIAADEVFREYPNPHLEIARLSELLGEEVYIEHFSANGDRLRIRGRATDAASVMQTLTEVDAFARVTAPRAISTIGSSGVDQFYLDIELLTSESRDES